MVRIAALMELQPAHRRESQEARNHRGRDTSPEGDVLMEQILENLSTTPRRQVLKKIASLPRTRQDQVLDVRRRIAEGTYELDEQLDEVIDRVLEAVILPVLRNTG